MANSKADQDTKLPREMIRQHALPGETWEAAEARLVAHVNSANNPSQGTQSRDLIRKHAMPGETWEAAEKRMAARSEQPSPRH